jgi:hypothetical protein
LALANGHGRHITVSPEQTLASVGRGFSLSIWPSHFRNRRSAVSEVKPPPGSRSGLKNPLELLESSIFSFRMGCMVGLLGVQAHGDWLKKKKSVSEGN